MSLKYLLAGLRRWAWAGLLLWLLVTTIAIVGYARTPPTYVATQRADVALVAIGPLTQARQEQLDAQARATASLIASPGFLSSPSFLTPVVQQFTVSYGTHAPMSLSVQQAGAALSATHTGTQIVIAARFGTTRAAEVLAQTAVQALAQQASKLLPAASDATIRIIPSQMPPRVVRDTAADEATRNLLLARLALALVTGLLTVGALAWLGNRASQR